MKNSQMAEAGQIPLVSIIMPTYNRAGLIMETIESIRNQTYPNWELIIVDDGSEDDTSEIVAKLADSRIMFLRAGRIGIGGKIKNLGISKANGEFIAFIDSDDLWATTKLEKQVAALQQYQEAGFCLTGGYIFRLREKPDYLFYKDKVGLKFDNLYTAIFNSEVTSYTQALMIRKQCLDITGLFKEEKSFSDLEFIIAMAEHFKGVIIYEPLLYRRMHESNYISNTWEKSCKEGIEIILDNKQKLPRSVAANALFRAYIQWGEKYLAIRKKRKAIWCFLKAYQSKPLSLVPIKKMGKTIFS